MYGWIRQSSELASEVAAGTNWIRGVYLISVADLLCCREEGERE